MGENSAPFPAKKNAPSSAFSKLSAVTTQMNVSATYEHMLEQWVVNSRDTTAAIHCFYTSIEAVCKPMQVLYFWFLSFFFF